MDTSAVNHQLDLDDSLPNYPRQLRFRVRPGISEQGSSDGLVVLGTIVWMIVPVWPHYRWVSLAQIPYLIWVLTATVLQLSITAMNWGRA